jgi:hypothetical protein
MGIYIERTAKEEMLPLFGKLNKLIGAGDAVALDKPPASFDDVPLGKTVVVEVDNQHFSALGVAHDENEFKRMVIRPDHRPRKFGLVELTEANALAMCACNYADKEQFLDVLLGRKKMERRKQEETTPDLNAPKDLNLLLRASFGVFYHQMMASMKDEKSENPELPLCMFKLAAIAFAAGAMAVKTAHDQIGCDGVETLSKGFSDMKDNIYDSDVTDKCECGGHRLGSIDMKDYSVSYECESCGKKGSL